VYIKKTASTKKFVVAHFRLLSQVSYGQRVNDALSFTYFCKYSAPKCSADDTISATHTDDVKFGRSTGLSGGVLTDRLNVSLIIEFQRFNYQCRDHVTVRRLDFNLDSVRWLQLCLAFKPAAQIDQTASPYVQVVFLRHR